MQLELLKIGIPYHTLQQMEEEEINRILGLHFAILQKQREDQEAQQG